MEGTQLNNVFVERIWTSAKPTGAYKNDGIPCVLSPEGSLLGGQQESTDQLTDYSTPDQVYWTGRCGGISNVDNFSESSKTSLRNTTELDIQKQSLVVPFRCLCEWLTSS
jgi:hypothetical protein